MAIDFIKQRKKQKYLTRIVMVAFIIIAVILWFGYFKKSELVLETTPSFISAKKIKVDFNALGNQFFQESQIFEKVSSFEGEMGRENPFLPY